MSILNKVKKASSKIKEVSLTLIFIGSLVGTTLSHTASAAPITIENILSSHITTQNEKMRANLQTQLKESIDQQVISFSTNFLTKQAENWLNIDKEIQQSVSTQQENNIIANNINARY